MTAPPIAARAELDPFLFRRRVLVALVGVFLVFVLTRAVLLWWEYDRTLAAEQRRAENLAHVLAEHLNRTFGAVESAINQLALHSERIGGPGAPPKEWAEVLEATLSGLSGVGSLNVLDADGFVVLSTNPSVTGTSRRGLYLHRRLRDEPSGALVIGPATLSEHVSGVRIPVGRALHDAEGRFIGFLAATFQPERLRSFYEAIDVGRAGIIHLLNFDGHLLFGQPHPNPLRDSAAIIQTILESAPSGSAGGFLRAPLEQPGGSYLTAWRPLSRLPLIVTVSIAEADALSSWDTELIMVSGSSAGMAVLLALAGVWITASSRAHARTVEERDKVGAALQRSQTQFQAILDHSPSGIALKDRDGRYLLANRQVQEWLGRPQEEIIGKTATDLFSKDDAHQAKADDERVASTGAVVAREWSLTFPDGAVRRIVTTKFPVRFTNGTPVGVGAIWADVTASREAEDKLRQAQKMEAVGQLTGGVAHDFNNLLTAVIGNLDLVLGDAEAGSLLHRQLEAALRAALRGAELTHRLLAFARRQPLHPTFMDVNALIDECRVLLRRTLGAEIDIELKLVDGLWQVLVDGGQLENALLNLAINARDAMPDGGKLIVETSNVTLDREYGERNPDVVPGPHVMISVSDTGIGIEPEVIDRVFEPFFTTKAQGKGTGLGLSMVYGFAKQSGGHIRIYSELGQGTTVKLYLPRASGAEHTDREQHVEPVEHLPAGDEAILVVEDDPDVAAFTMAALETLGYHVLAAADGPAAIAELRKVPQLHLLITDVVLPGGLNGREVAAKVQEASPATKVLFISGYAESIIVHQGRLEQGMHFLPKPFARAALARKVRAILNDGPTPQGRV